MSDSNQPNRLRELQEQVAREKSISPDTLRRLLVKVEEYSESHRPFGLPDNLLFIYAATYATSAAHQAHRRDRSVPISSVGGG